MRKPEIEKYYNQIMENPGKIFGFVYIYILVVGFAVGIYYVTNLGLVARQSVSPQIPDSAVQQDLKVTEAKIIPPVDMIKAENPDQQMLDNGKTLYASSCASCHGETGKGDGSAGIALNPKPRNFTSVEGWKNGSSLSGIYKTLEEGIPGSGMISYNYLIPQDRIAILHFIRNNFIPDKSPVTKDELTLLDQTYRLSAGTELAAQIPVNEAMNIYLLENRSKTDRLINIMREISSSGSEGGKIFSRITSDRAEAVNSLVLNNEWMNDKNKMIRVIMSGVNRNGFNSEVYNLNEDEWSKVHNFLSDIFRI